MMEICECEHIKGAHVEARKGVFEDCMNPDCFCKGFKESVEHQNWRHNIQIHEREKK
jgi:hypothetical protein